jgi:hypothetical protein
MQNAKAMACKLGDLKNSYGTGHGRAMEPQVADELDATSDWNGTLTPAPARVASRIAPTGSADLRVRLARPTWTCHDPHVWHN